MTAPKQPTPPARAPDARGLPPGYVLKPEWEVTPRHAASRLAAHDPAFVLLDCRRPDEHQTARIDGATLIPSDQVERRADELESRDGARDREIIVHCHHGVRSLKVTAALRSLGFTNVKSMAGGIDAWSLAIDPRVPRY